MIQIKATLFIFLFFLPLFSHAGLYLGLGAELGGDTVAETSDEDVNFGGGLQFAIGYENVLESGDKLRFSIGSLTDEITGILNGNIVSFETSATALELTYLLVKDNHSVGFGASLHQAAELKVTTNGISLIELIDDSVGFFALYEFNLDNGLDIGIRYTVRDYELSTSTQNANSLGFIISTSF